ncbi:venom carboxylesterase-6-like [Epargyreus clarus]|uniref:venom carboxylesterase-6-like n=1 Tax=Epargyreus clarus TaxID=520877 RepID=UPI003C30594E
MWSIIGVSCVMFLGILGQSTDVDLRRVTIAQGTVVGSRANDGDYFEFHGIPYADSTSGRNRFKAPTAPPTFKDAFIANRKDIKCVRALGVGYEGTEDCLVANVFTPSISETDLLPVMVWIKGKEFDQVQEPQLSFRNFVEKDVIIVSLNYRESVLGYLCLGTETAPGNAGLKDIIAGLRWIRQNIAQFGGNPDNITLFGHGSGAAAVDLVSLSPMSNNLINKVIAQSGTALAPWAVTRDNIKYAVDVAEALGHEITTIEQLSEVFTRTSVAALIAVINELDLMDNSLAFAPCIEKESLEGSSPFLLKSPYDILVQGDFVNIPFMAGFVDKEGTIRAEEALEQDWLEKMDESFIDFIQPDLIFENDQEALAVVNEIKRFYFNGESIDMSEVDKYLAYHGDTMILVSTLREARMRALTSTSPIYLYQFSYKGSLGEPFVGPLPVEKVAHSEELAYLFRDFTDTDVAEIDLTVSDILIERWTNFAKNGVPESETSLVEWRPYTSTNSYYLRILDNEEVNREEGGSLEIELENPHPETMSFWEQIYEEHFLNAEGRWDLTDRGEGDNGSEEGDGSGDEDGSGDGDGSGEDGGGGEEDGSEEDGSGEEDNEGNSASRFMGCTFLIVSLYTVLDRFHLSQLIS